MTQPKLTPTNDSNSPPNSNQNIYTLIETIEQDHVSITINNDNITAKSIWVLIRGYTQRRGFFSRLKIKKISTIDTVKLMIEHPDDLQIIDLRTNHEKGDWHGGHMRNAINIPFNEFKSEIPNIYGQYKDKQHIIFHCMHSTDRSPEAQEMGKLYFSFLKQNNPNSSQCVYVLEGGFSNFLNSCIRNKTTDLIEDLDKSKWEFVDGQYCHITTTRKSYYPLSHVFDDTDSDETTLSITSTSAMDIDDVSDPNDDTPFPLTPLTKSGPYWLPELKNDINRVYTKIQDTGNHHCFMKIEIDPKSKEFDKNKLIKFIKMACEYTSKYGQRLVIYYTGHGQDTGNWILNPEAVMSSENLTADEIASKDSTVISLNEIFESIECVFTDDQTTDAIILADCCFSDEWVEKIDTLQENEVMKNSNTSLHIVASAEPQSYGGSGAAKDGKFSRQLVQENMNGNCYYGKVNKDEYSIQYWKDSRRVDSSKRIDIRRKSMEIPDDDTTDDVKNDD